MYRIELVTDNARYLVEESFKNKDDAKYCFESNMINHIPFECENNIFIPFHSVKLSEIIEQEVYDKREERKSELLKKLSKIVEE